MKQGAILMALFVLVHHAVALVHASAHNELAVFCRSFKSRSFTSLLQPCRALAWYCFGPRIGKSVST